MLFARRRRCEINSCRPKLRAFAEALESRRLLTADVWSGAGTDSLFSNPANWQGGVAPVAGQDVTFPSGVTKTAVTINSNVSVGTVEIDATYTLSSAANTTDSITLNGSVYASAGTPVINSPIVLGQTTTIVVFDLTTLTVNGISGASGLGISKQGNGTLDLLGTGDTYTGTTAVQGGTLVSLTNLTSAVDVSAGSTFDDNGSVASLGGSGGTYSAVNGAAAGAITVASNLTLAADSANTLVFDIGGPIASSKITVTSGTISLGDAALTGTTLTTYTPTAGDVITLIQNNTGTPIVGTFSGLAEGATVALGGEDYSISYVGGSTANSVTLTALQATSSITLTANRATIYEGHTVQLTATVTGAGTIGGSVRFYENFTLIGPAQTVTNGVAVLNVTTLPAGEDTITATYTGDGTHTASTSAPVIVNVRGGTVPTIENNTPEVSTHGYTVSASVFAFDTSTSNLIYSWTAIHLPSGARAPIFNTNNNNAAQTVIVRFSKDGGYILQCKVSNTVGNSVTTNTFVTVSQKATTLRIQPHKANIAAGGTLQYKTTVLDQFNHPMRTVQPLTYAVTAGRGTISATGLFSATSIDGAVLIEVDDNLLTGTVAATVV